MCDIHLENDVDIVEVDKLSAGNDITTFHVNGFKCGVAICYDANFDEFVKLYGKAGMKYRAKKSFVNQYWGDIDRCEIAIELLYS